MRRNHLSFIFAIVVIIVSLFWLITTEGSTNFPQLSWLIILLTLFVIVQAFLRAYAPIPYFSMLLKLFPGRAAYYTHRGGAYIARRQYQFALQDLNRASELGSKMVETYDYRGVACVNLKEYRQAIQNYDHALTLNPKFAVGYSNRGWAYLRLKEYGQAIQDFDRSIELIHFYPDAYYGRGFAFIETGEYMQALQDFETAIPLYSGNKQNQSEVYLGRGLAYHNMGEYKRALQDFNYVRAIFPQWQGSHANAGFSYVFLKEYQLAIQACNQALAINPKNDPAYNNRGKAYLGLNDLPQARADFARAVEIDPTYVTHVWYLEWCRLCQERPDHETAERLLAIAELNGKHYHTYTCRGAAHWINGANEEALEEFEQSIQKKIFQWDAYFWKGMACASLGRDDEARAAIQHALAQSMPTILLSPLRWLERERPELYQEFAHL